MARPERFDPKEESGCVRLTGVSPVAVGAGAPRSRFRARSESESFERNVNSPQVSVRSLGGEQVGGPNRKVNLAAS